MASTFTTLLRLNKPALGDAGWGTAVNGGFTDLADSAIAGTTSVDVTLANATLTSLNGAADQARQMFLVATGTPGVAREVIVPATSKLYFVKNESDDVVTFKVSGQTGVAVPVNASMALRVDTLLIGGADVGPALTHLSGTPTAPTAAPGTNTTQIATTAFVQAAAQAALQALHPVGSVYINATNATNPGTLLGFGTWTAFGAGRVPVGFDAADPLFDTAEETGGSKDAIVVSHSHSITDPGHAHSYDVSTTVAAMLDSNSNVQLSRTSATTGTATTGISIDSAGSSGTNGNLQPYITVYMWKRTA